MKNIKKITAVLTAVIGIVVIILGATLVNETANHSVDDNSFRYVAEDYSVSSAAFGTDYYTYTYRANKATVDALNAINKSMETVVRAENSINAAVTANVLATDDLIETVYKVGGMIIIAIGLAILAYAMQCFGIAFAPAETSCAQMEVSDDCEVDEEVQEAENVEPVEECNV